MSLLSDKRVLALLVGFVLSAVAFVGVVVVGVLSALSAITAPANASEPLLYVLIDTLLPFVVLALVLGAIGLVLLAALLWIVAQNVELESQRLADLAERAEREFGVLRGVGLSDRLSPEERSSGRGGKPAGSDSTS